MHPLLLVFGAWYNSLSENGLSCIIYFFVLPQASAGKGCVCTPSPSLLRFAHLVIAGRAALSLPCVIVCTTADCSIRATGLARERPSSLKAAASSLT